MSKTRKNFTSQQICPRCLSMITDEFTISTPDGLIHEACESLPRPSSRQRRQSTAATRAANAMARNRRRLG